MKPQGPRVPGYSPRKHGGVSRVKDGVCMFTFDPNAIKLRGEAVSERRGIVAVGRCVRVGDIARSLLGMRIIR